MKLTGNLPLTRDHFPCKFHWDWIKCSGSTPGVFALAPVWIANTQESYLNTWSDGWWNSQGTCPWPGTTSPVRFHWNWTKHSGSYLWGVYPGPCMMDNITLSILYPPGVFAVHLPTPRGRSLVSLKQPRDTWAWFTEDGTSSLTGDSWMWFGTFFHLWLLCRGWYHPFAVFRGGVPYPGERSPASFVEIPSLLQVATLGCLAGPLTPENWDKADGVTSCLNSEGMLWKLRTVPLPASWALAG